ncbi:hypothetical protein [Oceanobacillus halophilus]|uniref:Uncharacterized protein n=1 Tax=Oceanobacillus halophilus TaxID=930130 RepID=A0A495AD68_9BACI|nr:hypothetical protein [Oceanobacillus halophilus]RKQ37812.1 hypothetical protein D8M06_03165 [Oceanobacillus halophilus]
MSDNRIATIVKEIEYWKDHKLLPEQYCDFLLALYTNGEGEPTNKKRSVRKVNIIIQILLLVVLLPFSFLVVYFTKFPELLQLGILSLFICYSIWSYIYWKRYSSTIYHISLIITLSLVLLFSLFIVNLFSNNNYLIFGVILLNFVLWLLLSERMHIKYLKYTSIFGVLFAIFYIVL